MHFDRKDLIKITISVISFSIGFALIKGIASFANLLELLIGVVLILIIPAFTIAPLIARLLSSPVSSFIFPGGDHPTQDSIRAAYHKVAEIKHINRPEEALKDYESILQRWNNDSKAHIAILNILFATGKLDKAEIHYRTALKAVRQQDKEMIRNTWNNLAGSQFPNSDHEFV